ncbi:F-actin-capping protein subunit alpha [Filobasidium floriforme]|uniref:F-actin-capping protein subunit alpha n=1 Tax=Filobasidium floriforme TaxID=5210 RepID=UPI001E8E32EE|nr:F-actin-capping protein subunit alpha [Filobasidium floriforme]KAH8080006.1 F-actin-capping protein subunit alpha [Filobasidium floriforme]
MSDQLSPEERYDLATKLIVQSPPGQVNDVIAAIQIIVDDNTPEFKQKVLSRLREYHQTQLQSVTLDGSSSPTLISTASIALSTSTTEEDDGKEDRYVDPQSRRSFKLDHFTLKATDFLPYEIKPEFETFRTDLQTALTQYIAAHYPSSEAVGSVFCSARPIARKAPQAEVQVQDQAQAVGGAETGKQEQAEGDQKEVEDDSKTSRIAATQVEDKSDPDLPAEAEIGEGVVQKEDSTTVPDPAAESGVDTQAGTPNAASAEPTVSSADPAADPSASTGTGTETSETGILAAANSAVAAVSETVETVKEALVAEVPVGGVAGLESEKPAVVSEGEDTKTENENPGQEVETKGEAAEEPVQEAQEEEEEPRYTICIVSNKYNTNNFWTGRWRSTWTVDTKADKLHGEVFVDVHYFEAGNVQLSTTQSFDLPLPPAESGRAGKIVNGIAKLEAEYQLKLAETNQQFGDKEFRSLRRALPITRTRVDWDKVSAYRLRSKA